MATIQNLTIDQDADFTQTLTIKDSAGDVVDLSGQTVTSKLRKTHLSSSATSFTTAIAFLAFMFSPVEQMTGYGISIAVGIMFAWILSTTLLPSMILLKKWNLDAKYIKRESFLEKIVRVIGNNISKSPKKVLFAGISLVLISIYGFKYIDVEVNTSKFFKKGQ